MPRSLTNSCAVFHLLPDLGTGSVAGILSQREVGMYMYREFRVQYMHADLSAMRTQILQIAAIPTAFSTAVAVIGQCQELWGIIGGPK